MTDLDHILRVLDLGVAELADVEQAFETLFELDEDTEVGDLRDRALDDHAWTVRRRNALDPWIFGELLHAETDALLLLIHIDDNALDDIALLVELVGVRNLLGPADVADMEKAVDARLDFDERAVVGEVANLAFDDGAGRVLLGDEFPRIDFGLLDTEGDLKLLLVDVEHDHIDFLADRHELARVVDAAGPRHLADVHEAFDTFLETHECAVGHEVDDRALGAAADWVLGFDLLPGRGFLLLQAEGDLLALTVDVQNLDLDLVADLHDLRRVVHAAPRHVGDVEQAVDAAEIHERAEVGDIGDVAAHEVALADILQQVLLLVVALILDELATRDDDIASLFVDLENHRAHRLADELADVARAAHINLRRRKEDGHADVDEQSALDLTDALALDDIAFLAGEQDLLPATDAVSLALGKAHAACLVFEALEEDFNIVAHGDIGVLELVAVNETFALQSNFDDNMVAREADDATLEDAARGVTTELLGDQCVHFAVGDLVAIGLAEQSLHFAVRKLEILDQVVVDHMCFVVSCTTATSRRAPSGQFRVGQWSELVAGSPRLGDGESATIPRRALHRARATLKRFLGLTRVI